MNNWKINASGFAMFIFLLVIGVMLWNKNKLHRAEELKSITDYIVEANFKHQTERSESNFIKSATKLEHKLIVNKNESGYELVNIESLALSLAPYNTELGLQHKLNLIKCLKSINVGAKELKCTTDYAKTTTIKGK